MFIVTEYAALILLLLIVTMYRLLKSLLVHLKRLFSKHC